MNPATAPLSLSTALTSWCWDGVAAAVVIALALAYGAAWRRADATTRRCAWWFVIGVVLVVVATMSMVGVYSTVLFWVRALQVLLLLFVAPFFLAMGRPVTVVSQALSATAELDKVLAARPSRMLLHPATTSVAMLATPWLLYLTGWYTAALQHYLIACMTNGLLLAIGFGYFYARLQTDPVPRRYSQLLSLVISIVESLGDGLLGIVLWLGPLIAAGYYVRIRDWGPSLRVDQSIGAGVLWLVGDVLGVAFIGVLMHRFSSDEEQKAQIVDAELDRSQSDEAAAEPTGLWWENDPQLRERMRRR